MAGEVVKAVGKLTGVPAIPGGIRRMAAEHLPMSSSARPFSVRLAAASASSGEEGADDLMPRVVFHGAPTPEEAREATSELIVGLEKMYPWSPDPDGPGEARLSDPVAPPPTVFTAFRLLRESSKVQEVVSSIACDPNVLKAVQENQELQEFLESERRRWILSHSDSDAERLGNDSSNNAESNQRFSFEDTLKIIKVLVDGVKNLSDIFIKLFGGQGDNRSSPNGDGAEGANAGHVGIESLLGLAIMVIMLIFLKRVNLHSIGIIVR